MACEPNEEGYREFSLGGFTFRRDEFFAHITWPTGSHVLSVDDFLRALQRDVAWDFFYGTVNFDGVFGTVNHYGTVDTVRRALQRRLPQGRARPRRELRDAPDPRDVQGDARRLDERRLRPLRQPGRDRQALRREERRATRRRSPAAGSPRHGWSACPATSRSAPTRPTRSTACSPTSPRTSRWSQAEPGFEGEVAAFNLFAYLSRIDVTWNPSVVSAARPASTARPPRSTSCRSSTATTASSGSSSSPTRSAGRSRIATPAPPRQGRS